MIDVTWKAGWAEAVPESRGAASNDIGRRPRANSLPSLVHCRKEIAR